MLGPSRCAGFSLVAGSGLLFAVSSLVSEHRLQGSSNCGMWAQ